MVLRYYNLNFLNIDEELEKIKLADRVEFCLDVNDKKCLFFMGILFAYGKKIKIMNKSKINIKSTGKSFPMMAYVWDKLGDSNFPNKEYSNIRNDLDDRIDNFKRAGVIVSSIVNNPNENKIFLICPVRNATDEQRKWIEDYVSDKVRDGYIIHAPHLHTRQTDMLGGYSICKQNAEAIASSNSISIYYDQSSNGSAFDLGVAYALNKKVEILNKEDIVFDNKDFIDKMLVNWETEIQKLVLK